MKKRTFLLVILFFVLCLIPVSFNKTDKTNYYFEIRYNLPNNIQNFTYPKRLLKKRFKYYWIDFQKNKSNLDWFEKIEINLTSSVIKLDIKEKYVIKKDLSQINLKDLLVFNLDNYTNFRIYSIIKNSSDVKTLKNELEVFCEKNNQKFLFEKGFVKYLNF